MSEPTRDIIHIKTVARYFIDNNTNMIPHVIIGESEPEWLQEYYAKFNIYDKYIYDTFWSWYTSVYLTGGREHESEYYVSSVLFANFVRLNNWKYQKIFDAMKLKYNPIENYRRNEETTDTYAPKLTKTNEKISSISDIQNGENKSNEIGTSQATIGANESSTVASYGNITDTKQVVPYNTTTAYDSEKNERAHSDDTTNITNGARNDNGKTVNDVTATLKNEHTVSDNTKETYSEAGETTNTHTNLTYGNIGVTTSQQMLNEEFNIANRSFLQDFFMDMIKNTCIDFDW